MKASEQYFPVVLFIVVLTFESVDEFLKCDHSHEIYWAVLSCGTVYYVVQGDSNFRDCECLQTRNWEFSLLGRLTNKQQDSKVVLT